MGQGVRGSHARRAEVEARSGEQFDGTSRGEHDRGKAESSSRFIYIGDKAASMYWSDEVAGKKVTYEALTCRKKSPPLLVVTNLPHHQ